MAKRGAKVIKFPVREIGREQRPPTIIPSDLRERLEVARVQSLVLFRALDRLFVSLDHLPQSSLNQLFHLDADCAEALAVLDEPPVGMSEEAMVRDTLASLQAIPGAREEFIAQLSSKDQERLREVLPLAESWVAPEEAYNGLPGRDPMARHPSHDPR